MRFGSFVVLVIVAVLSVPAASSQQNSVRTTYHIKQIASGSVYLDGGSDDGLKEGMHLKIYRLPPGEAQMSRQEIADASVVAVATISTVCEIKEGSKPVEVGDTAELSYEDSQAIELLRTSKSLRHVAQTVSFTQGDPIEDELRDYVPHHPSPEVNKIRGRVSFEQMAIFDHSSGMQTLQEGLVVRMDATRLGGTYWSFTGYWRGRLSSQSGTSVQTVSDLLNRTYTIGFRYDNPNSRYVAGFGRFLLPWAPSLNTMDGGYFGRRLGKGFTVGIFAGSTPDPTAWNYNPNRQMAGNFVAYEYGSYESVRFTSTAGAAVTRSHWHPERQFLFFENSLFIGQKLIVSDSAEVDRVAKALTTNGQNPPHLARSFATIRWQPLKRLSFDVAHNYFRDVPTFDLLLLGTGLLDQYLTQGFTAGFRGEVIPGITLYGNAGRSRRQTDAVPSFNYSGGLTLARLLRLPGLPGLPRIRRFLPLLPALPRTPGLPALPSLPLRTDFRYAKFTSSFGSGSYASVTVSRQFTDKLRLDVQGGEQTINSPLTPQTRTKFGSATLDYLIGRHYIAGAGWTLYHGGTQNYDQTFVNFGYRF
jgi:hypothetical protein